GILIGVGRRIGLGPALNTLWTGVAYAVLDLLVPTLVTVVVFRYPVKQLIDAAKNFVKLIFNIVIGILDAVNAPRSTVHQVTSWKGPVTDHWQLAWLTTLVLYGLLTMYLVAIVSEIVLKQIPQQTLERQKAA
ncbi:MAG TPA: hypothetical protein VKX16_03130, partial [Chloroflexota bacterium]|nr:hypothetical protein [Chloroflexota bacterium]